MHLKEGGVGRGIRPPPPLRSLKLYAQCILQYKYIYSTCSCFHGNCRVIDYRAYTGLEMGSRAP